MLHALHRLSTLIRYYSKALSFNFFQVNTYTVQGFLLNGIFFILPSMALYIFVVYPYIFLNTLDFKWFIRIGLFLSLRSIISYWSNTFDTMIHRRLKQLIQEYDQQRIKILILFKENELLKAQDIFNISLILTIKHQQETLLAPLDLLLAKIEKFRTFLKLSDNTDTEKSK
jgi:hypothetical protein